MLDHNISVLLTFFTSMANYGSVWDFAYLTEQVIKNNKMCIRDRIDRTAQERVDIMLPGMMETAGVTEELKACDPMRWVEMCIRDRVWGGRRGNPASATLQGAGKCDCPSLRRLHHGRDL